MHPLLWAHAHPELCAALVWPTVSAILVLLFKPRTPEQYAAMNPRVASVFRLIAALGLDPVKALDALKKLVAGVKPPSPPPGLIAVVYVGAAMMSLAACSLFTKQAAKDALSVVQVACIIAHAEMPDSDAAKACEVADLLIPDVKRILAEHRAGVARAAKAGACGPDAGKP